MYQVYLRRPDQEKVVNPSQGGRIFEISWEPNFPVNNFARNNGKIRHHPHNNQREIVTNDMTCQKYTIKGSIY